MEIPFEDDVERANIKLGRLNDQIRLLNDELKVTKEDNRRLQLYIREDDETISKLKKENNSLKSQVNSSESSHQLREELKQVKDDRNKARAEVANCKKMFAKLSKIFNLIADMSPEELKGNIRVFCRVRPSSDSNDGIVSYPTSGESTGEDISLTHNGRKHSFNFDKVFNQEASQEDVFVEISHLVQSALDGYKVCIFAYGQTGSGKTYTMMGNSTNQGQKGVIPRALEQIFESSQSLECQGWKYKMQASMLEIYNETIQDLLSPSCSNSLESKQYSIMRDADLTIVDVYSVEEVSYLLQQATQRRCVEKTHMNEQSSRSHFVFTLRILGTNESTEEQVQGVLNLTDLAGNERLARSGAVGPRLRETQAINKSLSALGDVIVALAKKKNHVPFLNSKLTYLLQPYLSGESKTLMFINISPEESSYGETLSSLQFAARVKECEIAVPRQNARMQGLFQVITA